MPIDNSSKTKNSNLNLRKDQTVSGQGVAQQVGSGQIGGQRLKLGKNASYVGDTTNTFTTVTGAAPGESPGIISALSGLLPRPDSGSERAESQIAAGGDAARAEIRGDLPKWFWPLVIGGTLILVFFAWKKLRKKG